jgi:Zn-dependent M28 family amino/carboxypeptidase
MHRLIYGLVFVLFFQLSNAVSQQIDSQKLLQDIETLSSKEMEGRRTLESGGLKARKYIQDRFRELGLATQYKDYLQFFDFTDRRSGKSYERAANVVGFIAGEETDKIIVVTAHYDHIGKNGDQIFYGADDNASGVAALMAFAEHFSKNRPQHSMIFAALDAEELGIQGARAFVEDFPFPLSQVVLNINMDMISRNEDGEIYAVGTHHYPSLKPILEAAAKDRQPKLLFGHDIPGQKGDWTYSSDHAPFHRNKIPFIYFGVEDHEDYHKTTDTFDRIQPEFFVNAANLIIGALLALDRDLLED